MWASPGTAVGRPMWPTHAAATAATALVVTTAAARRNRSGSNCCHRTMQLLRPLRCCARAVATHCARAVATPRATAAIATESRQRSAETS